MFSTKTLVKVLLAAALVTLFAVSLISPASVGHKSSSVLMKPECTKVRRDLVSQFNQQHPSPPVRLIAVRLLLTFEKTYSTSFLSGEAHSSARTRRCNHCKP